MSKEEMNKEGEGKENRSEIEQNHDAPIDRKKVAVRTEDQTEESKEDKIKKRKRKLE